MADTSPDKGWVKYFDDENSSYYWHNSETGESRWEGDTDDNSAALEEDQKQQQQHKSNKTSKKEKERKHKSGEANSKKKRDRRRNDRDDDDEFIDLLREQDLLGRTGVDIYRYRRCFYLNVLLLEYPLVVMEGCVRACLLGLLVVVQLVAAACLWVACSRHAASCCLAHTLLASREVVLTTAATLSLLVPFVILFVYRDYDTEHAWDLSPVPTVLGAVDARRFGVVTLGHGSDADNVDIKLDANGGAGTGAGTGAGAGARRRAGGKTQDAWGGGDLGNMLLFPRVCLKHLLD